MKNYKSIVPIVLIVLFIASIYMMFDAKLSEKKEYNEYLTEARASRELDVQVDAEEYYKKALDIKPTLDLYMEIAEFYHDTNQTKKALSWGDAIIKEFPTNVRGYEFLIDMYIQRKDYVACFDLYDIVEKRNLKSENIQNSISGVEYEFFYNNDFANVGVFSDGFCPVLTEDMWGYANTVGDKVIESKFKSVGYFSQGLAPVIDKDGISYFIDEKGNKKKVIKDIKNVEKLGFVYKDVYPVFNGNTWSLYNDKEEQISGEYEQVSSIGNGIMAAMVAQKWSLINSKGEMITDRTYDNIVMDDKQVVFRNDRIFVYDNLAYYMIDESGNVIGDKFEDAHIFNDATYAAVKKDGKWGFIDKDANFIVEPTYEDARSFSNGLAAVKYAGKWGFVNIDGAVVITPQFEDVKDFTSDGSVFVSNGTTWKLLRLFKYNH